MSFLLSELSSLLLSDSSACELSSDDIAEESASDDSLTKLSVLPVVELLSVDSAQPDTAAIVHQARIPAINFLYIVNTSLNYYD